MLPQLFQLSMSTGMCLLMAWSWSGILGRSLGEQSKFPQLIESSDPPLTRLSVSLIEGTTFSASLRSKSVGLDKVK